MDGAEGRRGLFFVGKITSVMQCDDDKVSNNCVNPSI